MVNLDAFMFEVDFGQFSVKHYITTMAAFFLA